MCENEVIIELRKGDNTSKVLKINEETIDNLSNIQSSLSTLSGSVSTLSEVINDLSLRVLELELIVKGGSIS